MEGNLLEEIHKSVREIPIYSSDLHISSREIHKLLTGTHKSLREILISLEEIGKSSFVLGLLRGRCGGTILSVPCVL